MAIGAAVGRDLARNRGLHGIGKILCHMRLMVEHNARTPLIRKIPELRMRVGERAEFRHVAGLAALVRDRFQAGEHTLMLLVAGRAVDLCFRRGRSCNRGKGDTLHQALGCSVLRIAAK